jgi:hypothetical protein
MNNIVISKANVSAMKKAYQNDDNSELSKPIKQKTKNDLFVENKYKFFHIAIIAGVTYILLKGFQNNEPPIYYYSE